MHANRVDPVIIELRPKIDLAKFSYRMPIKILHPVPIVYEHIIKTATKIL